MSAEKNDENFVRAQNPCGISDNVMGICTILFSTLAASINATMMDVAEDDGVSTNAISLYSGGLTFICATSIDVYFWYVGYPNGQHVCNKQQYIDRILPYTID